MIDITPMHIFMDGTVRKMPVKRRLINKQS